MVPRHLHASPAIAVPARASLLRTLTGPLVALRVVPLAGLLAALAAGCGGASAQDRVCRPVNSWSAPVFACAPAEQPEAALEEPAPAPEAAPEEPEPERVVLREDKIEIRQQVQFQTGEAVLLEESKGLLDEVARLIQDNPQIKKVRVEGHTDSVGGRKFNKRLSRARAQAVRAYLVAQGVAPERLVARGYGMSKPLASNDTEEGRAENRRVAFTILERAAE